MPIHLYILECADGMYYVGTSRVSLESRVAQHNNKSFNGWTAKRLPVKLAYACEFERITEAIAAERQIKNWSKAKKKALIDGNYDLLSNLAKKKWNK